MAYSSRLAERRGRGCDEKTLIFDKSSVKRYRQNVQNKFHTFQARRDQAGSNNHSWERYSQITGNNSGRIHDPRITPPEYDSCKVSSAVETEIPYSNNVLMSRGPTQYQENMAWNDMLGYSGNDIVRSQCFSGTGDSHTINISDTAQRDWNIPRGQLDDNSRDSVVNESRNKQYDCSDIPSYRNQENEKSTLNHRGIPSTSENFNFEPELNNCINSERTFKYGLVHWTDCRYAKMKLNKNCVKRSPGLSKFLDSNKSYILKGCWLKEIVPRKITNQVHISQETIPQMSTTNIKTKSVQSANSQGLQDASMIHSKSNCIGANESIVSQEMQESQVLLNQRIVNGSDQATKTDAQYLKVQEGNRSVGSQLEGNCVDLDSLIATHRKSVDNMNSKESPKKDDTSTKSFPRNENGLTRTPKEDADINFNVHRDMSSKVLHSRHINAKVTDKDDTNFKVMHRKDTYSSSRFNITHNDVTSSKVTHKDGSNSKVTHKDGTNSKVTHKDGTNSKVTHKDGTNSKVTHNKSDTSPKVTHKDGTSSKVTHKGRTSSKVSHEDNTSCKVTHKDGTSSKITHKGRTSSKVSHEDDTSSKVTHKTDTSSKKILNETSSKLINKDKTYYKETHKNDTSSKVTHKDDTSSKMVLKDNTNSKATHKESTSSMVTQKHNEDTMVTHEISTSMKVPYKGVSSSKVTHKDNTRSNMTHKDGTSFKVTHKGGTSFKTTHKEPTSSMVTQKSNIDTKVSHEGNISSKDDTSSLVTNKDDISSNMAHKNTSSVVTNKDDTYHKETRRNGTSSKVTHHKDGTGSTIHKDDTSNKETVKEDTSSKTTRKESTSSTLTQKHVKDTKETREGNTSSKVAHKDDTSSNRTHKDDTGSKVTHKEDTSSNMIHRDDTNSMVTQNDDTSVNMTHKYASSMVTCKDNTNSNISQRESGICIKDIHKKKKASSKMAYMETTSKETHKKDGDICPKVVHPQNEDNAYKLKTSPLRHVGTPKSKITSQVNAVPNCKTSVSTDKMAGRDGNDRNTSCTPAILKNNCKEVVSEVPQRVQEVRNSPDKYCDIQTMGNSEIDNLDSENIENIRESIRTLINANSSTDESENINCMLSKGQVKQMVCSKDTRKITEDTSKEDLVNQTYNKSGFRINNTRKTLENTKCSENVGKAGWSSGNARKRKHADSTEKLRGKDTELDEKEKLKRHEKNSPNEEVTKESRVNIKEKGSKVDNHILEDRNSKLQGKTGNTERPSNSKVRVQEKEKGLEGTRTIEKQLPEKGDQPKEKMKEKMSVTKKINVRNMEEKNSEKTKETKEKNCLENKLTMKDRIEMKKRNGIVQKTDVNKHTVIRKSDKRNLLKPLDREVEKNILKTLLKYEIQYEKREGKKTGKVNKSLKSKSKVNTSSDREIRDRGTSDSTGQVIQKNSDGKSCESENHINIQENNKRKPEDDHNHENPRTKKNKVDETVNPNEETVNGTSVAVNQVSSDHSTVDKDQVTSNEDESVHYEAVRIKEEYVNDVKSEFDEKYEPLWETPVKTEPEETTEYSERNYSKKLELECYLEEWMQVWVIKKNLFDDFFDMLASLDRPVWKSENHSVLYNIEVNMRIFFLNIYCNQFWDIADVCKSMQEFPKLPDFFISLNKL